MCIKLIAAYFAPELEENINQKTEENSPTNNLVLKAS